MRSFITGIDSFIGGWLARHLLDAGDEVHGLSRREAGVRNGVTRVRGDLLDRATLGRAINDFAPDRVFHLAAQSLIPYSFARPQETISVNVVGSLNLFDALRSFAPQAVLVSVGSSAEYGKTANRVEFIDEDAPLEPTSPYGVSKLSQGMLATMYARVHALNVLHVRPFAIIGPGKIGDAVGDFCRGVVEIEAGETTSLTTGFLGSIRDFVDVRDAAAALALIAAKGAAGQIYNLCNARAAGLEDIVQLLRRLSSRPFGLAVDPQRLRPVEDLRIVGNNQKLRNLGYAATHSLEDTIRDVLQDWRAKRL